MALFDEETNQLMVHSLDSSQYDKFLLQGALLPIEGTLNGLAFTSREPLVRNRLDPNESSFDASGPDEKARDSIRSR